MHMLAARGIAGWEMGVARKVVPRPPQRRLSSEWCRRVLEWGLGGVWEWAPRADATGSYVWRPFVRARAPKGRR